MADFSALQLIAYFNNPGVDAAALKAAAIALGLASAEQGEKADSAIQQATLLIALNAVAPSLPTTPGAAGSPRVWLNGGTFMFS